MKKINSNNAVTEIIGTILLLAIAIALFSIVHFIVFSYPFPNIAPSVSIVGTIEEGKIIIEHHGGVPLSLDTEIHFRIGSESDIITISGDNYLSSEAKDDLRWGIGEKIIYQDIDPTGENVEIIVVDVESNSVVMRSTLQ